MPRIIEYTSRETAPGAGNLRIPLATGEAFGARVGRAQQRLGEAVRGFAIKARVAEEKKDLSRIQTEIAKARAEITDELTTQVSEGRATEEDFTENFGALVSDKFDKIRENVTTPTGNRALDVSGSQIAAHFSEQTGIAKATAEGELAADNFNVYLNESRNALLNDPLQFDSILQQLLIDLNNPAGQFAELPESIRRDIERNTLELMAKSAVEGAIRNFGPEFVLEELQPKDGSAGKFDKYLDADVKDALIAATETELRNKRTEETRLRIEEDRQKRLAREEVNKKLSRKYLDHIIDPVNNPAIGLDEIRDAGISGNDRLSWSALFQSDNDRVFQLSRQAKSDRQHDIDRLRKLMLEDITDTERDERNRITNKFLGLNPLDPLTEADIRLSSMAAGDKTSFSAFLKAAQDREFVLGKRAATDDYLLYRELMRRVHLPEGHPDRIISRTELHPFINNGIGQVQYGFLEEEIGLLTSPDGRDLATVQKNFMEKVVGPALTRTSILGKDAKGDAQVYLYEEWMRGRVNQTKDIVEKFALFNPRSSTYIGSDDILSMFDRSFDEKLQDQTDDISEPSIDIVFPDEGDFNKQKIVVKNVDGTIIEEPMVDFLDRIRNK